MTEHQIIDYHIKQSLYKKQNGLCAYCRQHRNHKYMTVDHIIPLSKGGMEDISNLQCTCKKCNGFKGDMLPSEFTTFVRCVLKNSIRIEKEFNKKHKISDNKYLRYFLSIFKR